MDNEILKKEYEKDIDELRSEIEQVEEALSFDPNDFFPDQNNIDLNLDVKIHDYEKDIELIRDECKETLECLANLYLNDDQMKTRNIYKIIKDDSMALSKLNFVRGNFTAVKGKISEIRNQFKKKIFICPGECGTCTSAGHACGNNTIFKNMEIVIPIH